MNELSNQTLLDVIAALSHDLRSTLSSASLAAGLMSTHADDEVKGFSRRLNRTVQTQTTLLNLVGGLVESLEGDSADMTLPEFRACLQEQAVEVQGAMPEPPEGEAMNMKVRSARPIAAALARLLKGGRVRFDVDDPKEGLTTSPSLTLWTEAECEPPVSRSTPHVILAACGVRMETNENGSRFVIDVIEA